MLMGTCCGGCAAGQYVVPWVHNDGANWAFADGHVKWLRIRATLTPKNMWFWWDTGCPGTNADAVGAYIASLLPPGVP